MISQRPPSPCQPLLTIHPGQDGRIKLDGEKGWKTPARVIAKCKDPRSYLVETENGTVLLQKHRHLQVYLQPADPPDRLQKQLYRSPAEPASNSLTGVSPNRSPVQRQSSPVIACFTPGAEVHVTFRGHVVRVPLRYSDT
ncbi:hypothetical protein XENOCAPTIV_004723 [Xenoophorus captivus]|uniref:Uncharacterized protein n=1 Tax=Xenoophorus captivus TaxID=1517983 RepID=A0ABV0RBR5_9TELE